VSFSFSLRNTFFPSICGAHLPPLLMFFSGTLLVRCLTLYFYTISTVYKYRLRIQHLSSHNVLLIIYTTVILSISLWYFC